MIVQQPIPVVVHFQALRVDHGPVLKQPQHLCPFLNGHSGSSVHGVGFLTDLVRAYIVLFRQRGLFART
jgi:hypothetical protein